MAWVGKIILKIGGEGVKGRRGVVGWDKKEQRWGVGRVWFKRAFGCAGFMGKF